MVKICDVEFIKTESKGAVFHNFRSTTLVEAVISVGKKRIVLKGYPQVTVMTDSWKFGDQIQFGLYASKDQKVRVESRNESEWNTVEIAVSMASGQELLTKVVDLLSPKNLEDFMG